MLSLNSLVGAQILRKLCSYVSVFLVSYFHQNNCIFLKLPSFCNTFFPNCFSVIVGELIRALLGTIYRTSGVIGFIGQVG